MGILQGSLRRQPVLQWIIVSSVLAAGALGAAATVGAPAIGWRVAGAGGLLLLLVLVGGVLWAGGGGARRAAAALRAENRELGEQVGALRSQNDALRRQWADAQSTGSQVAKELEQLRADCHLLEDDRGRYEYALRVMADRSRRPVRHELQRIVYMIGETAADDVVTESYLTAAPEGTPPLLWHHLSLGLTNQSSTVGSFRDLEHTSVFEVLPNPPPPVKALEFLPTGRRDNRLGVLIFFEPEIGVVAREWRLTYRWPGMWDPLRERRRDTCILRLGESQPIQRDLLIVSFVFPLSAASPRARTVPSTPRIEPSWKADFSGRPMATFEIPEPGHEDYEWLLEVGGFAQRGPR